MFGLRLVTIAFAAAFVVIVRSGKVPSDVQDDVPQKNIVLIRQFHSDQGNTQKFQELVENNDVPAGSFFEKQLKGEPEKPTDGKIDEIENLNRFKRGIKKSFKKGGGGGGGKGGCKKGKK